MLFFAWNCLYQVSAPWLFPSQLCMHTYRVSAKRLSHQWYSKGFPMLRKSVSAMQKERTFLFIMYNRCPSLAISFNPNRFSCSFLPYPKKYLSLHCHFSCVGLAAKNWRSYCFRMQISPLASVIVRTGDWLGCACMWIQDDEFHLFLLLFGIKYSI